jgi:hypothetical protein
VNALVAGAIKASILNAPMTVVTGTEENNQVIFAPKWDEHPVIAEASLVSKSVVQVTGEALGTIRMDESGG